MRTIMGIQIFDREVASVKVQKLLTDNGCIIRTRLGLHEAQDMCSSKGLILVDFLDDKAQEIKDFKSEIESIDGVVIKTMEF